MPILANLRVNTRDKSSQDPGKRLPNPSETGRISLRLRQVLVSSADLLPVDFLPISLIFINLQS